MTRAAFTLSALLASACSSTVAYGPGVLVLPGSAKTFDQFRFDEQDCRGHAQARVNSSEAEQGSAGSMQQRYDRAFLQCMYAKGDKVAVSGRYFEEQVQAAAEKTAAQAAGGAPAEPQTCY